MTLASLGGILAFFFGSGAVTVALYTHSKFQSLCLWLMVFTTCYIKKPFYQEVFFINYRGVDRGFGVTLPDLFFFGFFIFLVSGGSKKRLNWLPFNSIPWFLLILVSILSLFGSLDPLLGMFSIHKLIRCWILYFVTVNIIRTRYDVTVVLSALTTAMLLQGGIVFWDKYITGRVVNRSIGSFRHPNTLAMYTNLIIPTLMGVYMISSFKSKVKQFLAPAITIGFINVLFTKSRAAMLLTPAALAFVSLISLMLKPTARKNLVMISGCVVAIIIGSMALPRLINRFAAAPKESAQTREYFNDAARAMARDNLFGIGINQYSNALEHTHYYWYVYADKEDVEDQDEFRESRQGQSRLGTVHHIYWLYAAETGYIGMFLFIWHCIWFMLYNLWLFIKEKDELFKSIYLGLLISAGISHIHGLLEWIFRQTEVQFLFFILMGMMVAMARIRREEIKAAKKAARKSV